MASSVKKSLDRFSLCGRRILLTGGAGGLGMTSTLDLARNGADLVVLDNDEAKIRVLRECIPDDLVDSISIYSVDLTNEEMLVDCLNSIVSELAIDVVINNAGIYPLKPFDELSIDDFYAVRRVNVDAGIHCVRAALPAMRNNNWGRIINVSSITVYGGWSNFAPYVESKAALVGLTRAWAREFGQWGITSNAIAPGAFPTDGEKIHPNPAEYNQFVLDHQSVKRRGKPSDISGVLTFLSSDASAFVSGQLINVDGGWVMK